MFGYWGVSMEELLRFDCKVRKHAHGQTVVTIPKKKAVVLKEDQPVMIVVCRRENKQTQLKKEVGKDTKKKIQPE